MNASKWVKCFLQLCGISFGFVGRQHGVGCRLHLPRHFAWGCAACRDYSVSGSQMRLARAAKNPWLVGLRVRGGLRPRQPNR